MLAAGCGNDVNNRDIPDKTGGSGMRLPMQYGRKWPAALPET